MKRIREIFQDRADNEHEQALVRLAISCLVVGYTALAFARGWLGPAATPVYFVYVAYFLAALGLVGLILVHPQASPVRRLTGTALDMGGLGATLYFLDAAGAALFPLYLWVIVGNGLRFGQRYLYTAMALAVTSFRQRRSPPPAATGAASLIWSRA